MSIGDYLKKTFASGANKNENHDSLCVLPWIHFNILPDGKVIHCCESSDYGLIAGDLNTQTVEEIWNGKLMKSLRRDMLKGKKPKICSRCYENECIGQNSTRIAKNIFFKDKLEEIPLITKADGYIEHIDLRFWDFRFSNLCNYKCRTCGPDFSNSWVSDAKELGLIDKECPNKALKVLLIDGNPVDHFIKKHIDQVQTIYFAGGEPLISDEHWQILEMLDERKRYDVIIYYNTNLSLLSYKNKNALEYWPKWGNHVWITPSIDEIDQRAELIRSGTNWNTVEKNLQAINDLGIWITPSITVSVMNVFRIPEIIDRLIDIGIIKQGPANWQNFSLNIVTYAPMFHVSSLPDHERKNIRKKLDNYILNYKQKYNVDIEYIFSGLFWHLEKPWNKKNALAFKEFTNSIDKLRNESTIAVIPELGCVLN